MRLRNKLLLTLAVLAVVAFSVILLAINAFVLPAFEKAEREQVGEGLTRALNVINISNTSLSLMQRTGHTGMTLTSTSKTTTLNT